MRKQFTKLPADRLTHDKYRVIADAKDWSITTAVDKGADALAEREQIKLPPQVARRRRHRTASPSAA